MKKNQLNAMLMDAVRNRDVVSVEKFLNEGASPHVEGHFHDGNSPLRLARKMKFDDVRQFAAALSAASHDENGHVRERIEIDFQEAFKFIVSLLIADMLHAQKWHSNGSESGTSDNAGDFEFSADDDDFILDESLLQSLRAAQSAEGFAYPGEEHPARCA